MSNRHFVLKYVDIDGDTYNQFNKSRGYWLQKARVGFIWGKCYPEPFGCGGICCICVVAVSYFVMFKK